MRLFAEPIWPWPITAGVILLLIVLVLRLYPRRIRHLSQAHQRWLIGLRLLAAILLGLAMLRPALEFKETNRRPSALLVLSDSSRSMTVPDEAGGKTRREALIESIDQCRETLGEIAEETELVFYDFADELTTADSLTAVANGQQSALGYVLDQALKESRGRKILGVLLMSDGAQRATAPRDQDPRLIARHYGDLQVPIYTVGFGRSALSEAVVDLSVEDLLVDPVVFEKKTVPVTARIRVRGAADQKLVVRLLVEDRTGIAPGQSGEMRPPAAERGTQSVLQVSTDQNDAVIPVELSFLPDVPGEFKIRIEVDPVETEVKLANNSAETILSVQKGGIRVLYVDRLRWESKFLKRIRRSNKIELDFFPIKVGPRAGENQLGESLFDAGAYDAYILGDVSAEILGRENIRKLFSRIREGAGFMMLGGQDSFAAGGYSRTDLADVVPVQLDAGPAAQINQDLQMSPTARGLSRFVMRLDNDPTRNSQSWSALPPLAGANRLTVNPGLAEVLAESEDGAPLLVSYEYGRARVLAFAGDTTWQWAMGNEAQVAAHERFWTQVILWLTRKDTDADQRVWVRIDPRNFNPRQNVPLQFGAREEDGSPMTDASFDVSVTRPDLVSARLAPVRSGNDQLAEYSETDVAGDYWTYVRATRDGNLVGEAWTRFLVSARDLELDEPAADLDLLQELSMLSGGASLGSDELSDQLTAWVEAGLPNRDMVKFETRSLSDNWPFLGLFAAALSAEWFLRKKRGLV